MKALLLQAYGEFLYTDVPEPEPAGDEVLVAVEACAICGSDVHGMDGSTGRRIPPVIMGHEAAGTVLRSGPLAKRFAPGDRVAMDSTIPCGTCPPCCRGEINLCDRIRILGVSCGEYRQNGAFAEMVAVPECILYPIPDGVPATQAALAEPLAVALHAIARLPFRPGAEHTAVVFGAGMIGLILVQALKAGGCGRILAVEPVPEKRSRALACGADQALDPGEDALAGIQADCSFEAVGFGNATASAAVVLRKGGFSVLVGNLSENVPFPLQTVVTRQLSVLGSCASSGEYPEALRLIADGSIDVRRFISVVAPLSEGAVWFRRLHEGASGLMKVVLHP